MFKFWFLLMGVPMIIMSFFQTYDILPYVNNTQLIVDGDMLQLLPEEEASLKNQLLELFENSHTVPAFGVIFDDMYQEEIKTGKFVSLKFEQTYEINGLPFDELVFKIEPDCQGFNLMRGNKGVFQGRCIYIDLEKDMREFDTFVNEIITKHTTVEESVNLDNKNDLCNRNANSRSKT